jgi:hypothetical protein
LEAEVEVAEAEVGIRSRDGRGGTSEVEVEAAEAEAAEAEVAKVEAAEAEVVEAEGCIGGIGMHQKSMEADRADRADGAGSEYKVLEAVKMVRTCQNLLRQNGTRLGLLLLPMVTDLGIRHLWNITRTLGDFMWVEDTSLHDHL